MSLARDTEKEKAIDNPEPFGHKMIPYRSLEQRQLQRQLSRLCAHPHRLSLPPVPPGQALQWLFT